jgi:hypothetical protein
MTHVSGNLYQYTISGSGKVAGNTVNYYVVAKDKNYNSTTSPTYTITWQNCNAPSLEVSPGNANPCEGVDVTVSATVTDNSGSGIKSVKIYVDGVAHDMTPAGGNLYQYTVSGEAYGNTVDYYVVAEDNDNNSTTSSTYTITWQDCTAPSLDVSPGNANSCEGVDVTVSATATDTGSGIKSVKIYVDGVEHDMAHVSGDLYQYTISGSDKVAGDTVDYYVVAEDNNSNTARDPEESNYTITWILCGGGGAAGGGGSCPLAKYLTVDWEGNNTTKPLYSNDNLAVDLLGPSPDGSNNLLLEQGTHAPVVDGTTYYLIVINQLDEIPALPENTTAIVVFNITPNGAIFDKNIFLTLGLNQTQLPANALNVTMAYYDDVNGVWVPLEYEAGGPNGVAELTLSAPINHFSIYGVLAELSPTTPTQPAHFAASGLSIMPAVEKTIFVTKTGESVTITANVANDGGQLGTYTVELKLNGQTVDTKTVILGAGQSKQVSFTQSGLDYGQYEVNVAGLSDTFTASQTINWWLIIGIIVAIGLIIWGVVWGIRRRGKAHQAAQCPIKVKVV